MGFDRSARVRCAAKNVDCESSWPVVRVARFGVCAPTVAQKAAKRDFAYPKPTPKNGPFNKWRSREDSNL